MSFHLDFPIDLFQSDSLCFIAQDGAQDRNIAGAKSSMNCTNSIGNLPSCCLFVVFTSIKKIHDFLSNMFCDVSGRKFWNSSQAIELLRYAALTISTWLRRRGLANSTWSPNGAIEHQAQVAWRHNISWEAMDLWRLENTWPTKLFDSFLHLLKYQIYEFGEWTQPGPNPLDVCACTLL